MMSKKEQILKATLKLIVEKGIESTPMSDIAKAADTGMGAIYHYFATKEILINELYLDLKAKESAMVLEGYDKSHSVKQRFIYLWKKIINHFLRERIDFIFLEQLYYSPNIVKGKHEGVLYITPLNEVYLDGQSQQIIKDGDIKEWIGFTSGSLLSLIKLHHSNYITLQEETIDRYIQASWDAIKS